jgi:hypothetical protein
MNAYHLVSLCRHIPITSILNVLVTRSLFALLQLNVTALIMQCHQAQAVAQQHQSQAGPTILLPDGK